jgi:hypothetical protein
MDRRPQRGRRRHAPGRVRRRRGPAGRVAGCDRGCHPGHRSSERQHSAPRRDACNQGRRRQSRRGPAAPAVDRDSLPSRERRPQRRRPRPGGRCLRPAGRGRSPGPWRSGRGRALPRGWRLGLDRRRRRRRCSAAGARRPIRDSGTGCARFGDDPDGPRPDAHPGSCGTRAVSGVACLQRRRRRAGHADRYGRRRRPRGTPARSYRSWT